jgi:hypothetical protein
LACTRPISDSVQDFAKVQFADEAGIQPLY